jgi:hypothetical protein
MTRPLVDRIADAVLYEGYILYPYRPAVKNRQRWTFGGLYPESSCGGQNSDSCHNQTECLIEGDADTVLDVTVRFLHLTERRVGEFVPPLEAWPEGAEPAFRPCGSLSVGDRVYHPWQEAEERTVRLDGLRMGELLTRPWGRKFGFTGKRWLESIPGEVGEVAGVLVRTQQEVRGSLEVSAANVADELSRVTVRVRNRTPWEDSEGRGRDEAVLRSLVSAHTILGLQGGEFVSLMDPPPDCQEAAAACRNVGVWPVLVGAPGQRDTVLSSPIILYDYPQVAPESPGDFFDGTEIDEMLTLRILTLTDDEKRAMAAVDERARALLYRTTGLAEEQLPRLHGAVRGLRPVTEGGGDEPVGP